MTDTGHEQPTVHQGMLAEAAAHLRAIAAQSAGPVGVRSRSVGTNGGGPRGPSTDPEMENGAWHRCQTPFSYLVGPDRFELSTNGLRVRCSTN
jgi:hypothetical protein